MINGTHIKQRGFTLIETIVYLAIFVTVTAASITLLLSLQELTNQYRVKQALLTSGSAIMERTLLEAREARAVVVAESVLASSTAGVLALEVATETATDTVQIIHNGTAVRLLEPAGMQDLHASDVTVDAFTVFAYETGTTGTQLVRVQLEVSATRRGYTESLTLQGGAIIRGSYVQ